MSANCADDGWARVDLLDETDSTNAVALAEPTPWHLVAAHAQVAGRGRLDRQWQTPAGAAVTVSLTVPLPAASTDWGWVPLFVGEAVRAALSQLAGSSSTAASSSAHAAQHGEPSEDGFERVAFATKWPNDVLARDPDGTWRKVAGILCQVAPGGLVVVGVGVNVTQRRDELPIEGATSLALAGLDVTRDDTLLAVERHVARAARAWSEAAGEALTDLREQVRRHCRTIGSTIDVHTPSGGVAHVVGAGIAEDGRLLTRAVGSRPDAAPTMAYSVADIVHARLDDGATHEAEGEA